MYSLRGSDPGKLLFLHPMMLKIRDEMGLECAFGGLKADFKKVNNIKTAKLPLSGYQENKFKLYLLDTGLLGAMINVPQKAIIEGDRLFSEYNGAFVENYVAQEFVVHGRKDLYYWSSKNTAEVDFVVALENQILPLEVKAGISRQKKSLRVYGEKFNPPVLSRSTLMNFKEDGKIRRSPGLAKKLH